MTREERQVFEFLSKESTIANRGFNRWLVPPAALCIHLCIGMAYGFSVFWLPFMTEQELAAERKLAHDAAAANAGSGEVAAAGGYGNRGLVATFLLFVGIPLAWGVWQTVSQALVLFR